MPNTLDEYKLYTALECSKNSSYDEIKRAYKKLVLLYHPDKSELSSVKHKFLEIAEAWRVLSDPELKKKYDAECRDAELESENILIYEKIRLEDMKIDGDDMLTYPCRCGSTYLLKTNDIEGDETLIYIACQECTFHVAVEKQQDKFVNFSIHFQ